MSSFIYGLFVKQLYGVPVNGDVWIRNTPGMALHRYSECIGAGIRYPTTAVVAPPDAIGGATAATYPLPLSELEV